MVFLIYLMFKTRGVTEYSNLHLCFETLFATSPFLFLPDYAVFSLSIGYSVCGYLFLAGPRQ